MPCRHWRAERELANRSFISDAASGKRQPVGFRCRSRDCQMYDWGVIERW